MTPATVAEDAETCERLIREGHTAAALALLRAMARDARRAAPPDGDGARGMSGASRPAPEATTGEAAAWGAGYEAGQRDATAVLLPIVQDAEARGWRAAVTALVALEPLRPAEGMSGCAETPERASGDPGASVGLSGAMTPAQREAFEETAREAQRKARRSEGGAVPGEPTGLDYRGG